MRVVFSPSAADDLREINAFIRQENVRAANAVIDAIRRRVENIGRFPEVGEKCEALAPQLRRVPVGNYVIFYRVVSQIEIVRVLHGAREIEAIFRKAAEE